MDRAVLELRKYSWADDKSADGKSNYSHIVSDNLCLILEGGPHNGSRLGLQVVQGTRVLDDIDLAHHIDAANNTRRMFMEAERYVTDRQLPTYAVSSGAKLAITHRKDDSKIHRMQIAFAVELDCERVVSLLKCRGMTFVAPAASASRSRTMDSHRPPTASTMLSRMLESPSTQHRTATSFTSPSASAATPLFARDERQAPRQLVIDRPTTREMYAGNHSIPFVSSDIPQDQLFTSFATPVSNVYSRSLVDQGGLTNTNQPSKPIWTSGSTPIRLETGLLSSTSDEIRPPTSSSHSPALSAQAKQQPSSTVSSTRKRSASASSSTRGGRKKRKAGSSDATDEIMDDASSMPPPTARPRSSMSRSSPKNVDELLHGKQPRRGTAEDMRPLSQQQQQQQQQHQQSRANTKQAQSSDNTQQISQAVVNPDVADITGLINQPGLEEYGKLPSQERDNMLRQFIISMLGNKSFERLCQDMSVCWQRYALDP